MKTVVFYILEPVSRTFNTDDVFDITCNSHSILIG